MTDINIRIRDLRKEKKLTQKEFCALIGTSQSYLSEVENGKGKPSLDMIIGIAMAFKDVSIRWLITGEYIEENQGTTINEQVLKEVIEVVEWALSQVNIKPSSSKKAELILAVYDFYLEDGAFQDKSRIIKLVKLVA